MAKVVFDWKDDGIALTHNRDKSDNRMIEAAAWDEDGQILRSLCEPNGGTWCGISKTGRLAFLVADIPVTNNRILLLPLDFLEGEMNPEAFARQLTQGDLIREGTAFNLNVGDIKSKSMFCISKSAVESHFHTKEVEFGLHNISSDNLLATERPYVTTALFVTDAKKVMFYETFMEEGEEKNKSLEFDIA